MATDPTCGMEVNETDRGILSAAVGGKKYYFCSDECRNAFLEKKQ